MRLALLFTSHCSLLNTTIIVHIPGYKTDKKQTNSVKKITFVKVIQFLLFSVIMEWIVGQSYFRRYYLTGQFFYYKE